MYFLIFSPLHLIHPYPQSPSHLPTFKIFSVSMSLFCLFILFCLDYMYKWNHVAFVFLCLTYFSYVHAVLPTTAKEGKQSKCPAVDEGTKKRWCLRTMEYDSAIKKNEILPSATTWMNLEGIMLNETHILFLFFLEK